MSILSIAVSGLNTAKDSLTVTSNNVANAGNASYTRQTLVQSTKGSNLTNAGFIGSGVDSVGVRRITNDFLYNQILKNTSEFGYSKGLNGQLARIDEILGNENLSMNKSITAFFNASQDLSVRPNDIPTRQNFLQAASNVVTAFNTLSGNFAAIREDNNITINEAVKDINVTTDSIAKLNSEISAEIARSGGTQLPNDLLDKREQLLVDLSEQVEVSTLFKPDGSVQVFLKNGQPLVAGDQSYEIFSEEDPKDPENVVIGRKVSIAGQEEKILFSSKNLGSGRLSALTQFRDGPLADYENTLGLVASRFVDEVNAAFRSGEDLNGIKGKDLFFYAPKSGDLVANGQTKISKDSFNTGTASLEMGELNSENIREASYEVYKTPNGDIFVKPLGSKQAGTQVIADTDGKYTFGNPDTVFTFALQPSAQEMNAGDSFYLTLTRNSAKNIALADLSVEEVVTRAAGQSIGDNSVAVAINALATKKVMYKSGGAVGVSISDGYNRMVSVVGNQTRQSKVDLDGKQSVLDQLQNQKFSDSGVNLDEEAANLIQQQQVYAANGKVIAMSKDLFDQVLDALNG